MRITCDGITVNYTVEGTGAAVIVLHGWGGSVVSVAPIQAHLSKRYRVYAVDLPGFGHSDPPPTAWTTEQYSSYLLQLFHFWDIKRPIIIGHSFGGRIAIELSVQQAVSRLVLVNSAGLIPLSRVNKYSEIRLRKAAKWLVSSNIFGTFGATFVELAKRRMGSYDYRNATPVMRDVLVKSVNHDLTNLIARISVPSLLLWGDLDRDTPINDGQRMANLIPGASFVVLAGAGHYSYIDRPTEFFLALDDFLAKENRWL